MSLYGLGNDAGLAGGGWFAGLIAKYRSLAQVEYAQFVLKGIKEAHATGAYSYQQIADYFEMHWGGSLGVSLCCALLR